MFNEVFDELVRDISGVSRFSSEEIRRCMERVLQPRRPDVTLFLMKISKNAEEDARELFEALGGGRVRLIENISMRGPLVSFDINKRLVLKDILRHIQDTKETFGNNLIGSGKRMVVDYSSPNIAKIFHIGHLRTTVLGQFIVNLLRASGYETVSVNYLGDWGKQFGFVLLGFKTYGDEEQLRNDPLRHLFDVYVRINSDAEKDARIDMEAREIFRKMEEERDEWCIGLWSKFRELSIEKYKRLYKRLNICFDVYSGESMYNERGREVVESCGLMKTDSDGSKVFDLGPLGNALAIKNDGTTLYMTRDIAAGLDRVERYSPEKIIYVVSCEQNRHFQQLFRILGMLGCDEGMFQHVSYGKVLGMSTRRGKVEFLEDILDDATDVMRREILSNEEKASGIEDIDRTAETLAISTLLVMDFSAKRVKGYEFDMERRAKNVSGTGPYLQYAHCRLRSIEARNPDVDYRDIENIDFGLIDTPEVLSLAYRLLWFEHVVEQCLGDYEPSHIVTYLQDLAGCINVAVNNLRVMGAEEDVARARLLVLSSARIVLHNGLRMLGITPLNKM